MTAAHSDAFVDVAPTGSRAHYEDIDFYRLREGKMSEHWTATDDLIPMQQLSVVSAEPCLRLLPG